MNDHNHLILFGFQDKNGDIGGKYRLVLKPFFDGNLVLEVKSHKYFEATLWP